MSEESELWRQVIVQAFKDALYTGDKHSRNGNPSHKDVAEAKAFLKGGDGFKEVCIAAKLDPDQVKIIYANLQKNKGQNPAHRLVLNQSY